MNAEKSPTLPPTTMSTPFIEMPQRNEASPSITSSPPCADAPADYRSEALTCTRCRHHVLGDTGSGVAMHGYSRLLVHPRAVVADVPFDFDLDRRVDTHRDVVRPVRILDEKLTRQPRCVQGCIYLPQRCYAQVVFRQRLHAYTTSGAGSQICAFSMPGSAASARYSLAIATQPGVSAITAGLHAIASRTTANESWLDTSRV